MSVLATLVERRDALLKVRASLIRDIDKTVGALEVLEKLISEMERENG